MVQEACLVQRYAAGNIKNYATFARGDQEVYFWDVWHYEKKEFYNSA